MPPALLRFWRLPHDLEPSFRDSQGPHVAQAFAAWCVLQGLIYLALFALVLTHYIQGSGGWAPAAATGALVVYFAALLLAQHWVGRWVPALLLPLSCVLLTGGSAAYSYLMVGDHAAARLQWLLSDAWDALAAHPAAQAQLEAVARAAAFHELCLAAALAQYVLLDGLRLTGYGCWGLLLHFLPLVAYGFLCGISGQSSHLVVLLAVLSLYSLSAHLHMNCILRSEFWVRHQLQQSLSAEAQELQRAREAEVAHKEAALKADSMLHHILKNIMADARGCIDMYLEAGQRHAAHLERGRACLERGMQWCMKRLVLMQIATGSYRPLLTPIDLKEFGATLISGRHVQADLPHLLVDLDPLLCSVVLDNALTNALRHGHPDDARVTFSIACHHLASPRDCSNQRLIVFRVTNRANPARPAVTPDFVADRLKREEPPAHVPVSPLPNGLGLQYLWLAAAAHNMCLSLRQVDETVVFEASLAVDLCHPPEKGSPVPAPHSTMSLSTGLHVYCLDDSELARRLLLHCLQVHLPQAKPRVFGATVDEIEHFISAALLDADIVILDQHLEYGSTALYGTDVVARLLENGFTGFVVMRSANSDDHHREHYQRCGAHLTVGKDVPGREMVAQVHHAYRQFLRAHLLAPTYSDRSERSVRLGVDLMGMEFGPTGTAHGPHMLFTPSEPGEPDKESRSDRSAATLTPPGVVCGSQEFSDRSHSRQALWSPALRPEGHFDCLAPLH